MLPDLYHAHHSRHMEDLPFWLSLAAQVGDPILELGCGTGRVLVPLAQAGYDCFGLDRDLGMLDFLRASLVQQEPRQPSFFAADICRFSLGMQFSLVIIPCNTLSTLNNSELEACLRCVHKHLQPGGLFAASLPNQRWLDHLPARSLPELEEEFIQPFTSNPVQVSSGWQRTRRLFTVTWIYDVLYPDGSVQRVTMQASHVMRTVQAYREAFRAAGFSIREYYGDYDRSNYSDESSSLVIVAEAGHY